MKRLKLIPAAGLLLLILLCAVAALALGIIFLLRSIDFAELPNDAVPYEHSIF